MKRLDHYFKIFARGIDLKETWLGVLILCSTVLNTIVFGF